MGKPGDKYRPSNGTEGMFFTEHFCAHCIHEKWTHTQKDGDKQCDILSNSMLYDRDDSKYPEEWTYDDKGKPTCTAWVKWDWGNDNDEGGLKEPPQIPPDDPNQLCLPFIFDELKIPQPLELETI